MPAILKAKSIIEKILMSFTNSADDSAINLLHLNHLREVRNFKKNGQFSDEYEKWTGATSNCNESDAFSQDISFEETSICVESDENTLASFLSS